MNNIVQVRLSVPETARVYIVSIDMTADPMKIADGIARELSLDEGTYYLRLRDSFVPREGFSLDLVRAEPEAQFRILSEGN